MNTQQELLIPYNGQQLRVTAHSDDADTFFTVYLLGSELELKIEYIDHNPCWTENGVL